MKKVLIILMLTLIVNMAYSQTGVIREFSGDVALKNAGASVFVPVQRGSIVAKDTVISTGFKSSAVIEAGGSTIIVRPLTRLTLSEISRMADTENLNINLQTGRIRVDVKPPAGTRANTGIQTTTATASVRGTSFDIDARNIRTAEGIVSYAGANGLPVMVTGGSASRISEDGEFAIDPVLMDEFFDISRSKTASFGGVFGVRIIVE